MGTAQLSFAVVLCGGATGNQVTESHFTESDVSHITGVMSGSMFCAYVTGSCTISALVGIFHR